MISNINDISQYIIDKFNKTLTTPLSDYEIHLVERSIFLPSKELSTSKAILGETIAEAIEAKSGINYMMMRIQDQVKLIKLNYQPKYNKLFTVLTRQGRPSKLAIDSEIMHLHPEMYEWKQRLDDLIELAEFLQNQVLILDMIIKNADNRRYEL